MRKLAIGAGVAIAAVLVLAGCAGQDEPAAPPSPSTSPVTSDGPVLPETVESLPPAPTDATPDDGVSPGRHDPAVWNDEARRAVLETAEKAMTAFSRPDLAHDTWWPELEPLLTPEAAQDYAYVDPANVPASAITGDARLVDDASAYLARVEVPTDAGTYTLVLNRADAAAPWLVSRFTPPEEEN